MAASLLIQVQCVKMTSTPFPLGECAALSGSVETTWATLLEAEVRKRLPSWVFPFGEREITKL